MRRTAETWLVRAKRFVFFVELRRLCNVTRLSFRSKSTGYTLFPDAFPKGPIFMARLCDRALLRQLQTLNRREHSTTLHILMHLDEVERVMRDAGSVANAAHDGTGINRWTHHRTQRPK